MHPREEDEDDLTLTEELRTVMRPRSGRLLVLLVLIALVLGALVLVASRTVLAGLWR
ncbi:MAG TPA: hypothetical protein VFZ09_11730 [Archangium sp.]|uniref:hypothetical protein n=1 Tax=Archangium sp. TaxID=1872627 RepID=UPI002E345E16|nr:hypothetical protein [Archangium sp.]HEX5746905.1 hypothetical protein [Archangium sp.]